MGALKLSCTLELGKRMYEAHFGMEDAPFRITPDMRHFYQGADRGQILSALAYAVSRGEGVVKVVGEVGSGKTMLCRALEKELPENVTTVYIANPSISADHFLNVVVAELGLTFESLDSTDKFSLLQRLQTWLLEQHEQGKKVVLFIEEAQAMPKETLEEIRLLANLETETQKLLHIILFGQPELDKRLSDYDLRPLRDRITHDFYLSPVDKADCLAYLNYRTRVAGYRGIDLFSSTTSNVILKHSDGLLRRINVLADKTLLACFAEGLKMPTIGHVKKAISDTQFGSLSDAAPRKGKTNAVIALSLLGVVLFVTLLFVLKYLKSGA